MGSAKNEGYVIPPRLWRWAADRRVWVVACWLVVLAVSVHHLHSARSWLANEPTTPKHQLRPNPGGHGHTQIDFGGQWVMGRMLVLGHGRELYHRQRQWEVVQAGFPVSDETQEQRDETILPRHLRTHSKLDDDLDHDANRMMYWFMGKDSEHWKEAGGAAVTPLAADLFGNPFVTISHVQAASARVTPVLQGELQKPAIGGPLYPPIHAFIYAPIGLFDRPQDAYYIFHFVLIGFSILAGRGLSILTNGWVWWPVATAGVLLYPGSRVGIDLGQNPAITLCIGVWGWVLVTRKREWAGGMIWGLFAFKPVWGMAFFLVPLLMGRWRICVSMVASGAGLAALTLPVVGLQTWFDWLAVGKEGAELYNRSRNWIFLSRDLQGIPRRFLHDFTKPEAERETPLAKVVAWTFWGIVFGATVLIYRLKADRTKLVGLGAAFLFLGAWLTCYRFMYYDSLVSIIGVACLLAEPQRFLQPKTFRFDEAAHSNFAPKLLGYVNSFPLTVILLLYLVDNWLVGLSLEATIGAAGFDHLTTAADGSTTKSIPRVQADSSINYPWDTALVLLLWLWCGIQLLRGKEPFKP